MRLAADYQFIVSLSLSLSLSLSALIDFPYAGTFSIDILTGNVSSLNFICLQY